MPASHPTRTGPGRDRPGTAAAADDWLRTWLTRHLDTVRDGTPPGSTLLAAAAAAAPSHPLEQVRAAVLAELAGHLERLPPT